MHLITLEGISAHAADCSFQTRSGQHGATEGNTIASQQEGSLFDSQPGQLRVLFVWRLHVSVWVLPDIPVSSHSPKAYASDELEMQIVVSAFPIVSVSVCVPVLRWKHAQDVTPCFALRLRRPCDPT